MAIPNDIILMLSGAILVLLIVVSCHNLGKTAQITPPQFYKALIINCLRAINGTSSLPINVMSKLRCRLYINSNYLNISCILI
jgi:hypothetical protein